MISSTYSLKFKHFSTLGKPSKLTKMFLGQFTLILFASTYFSTTEFQGNTWEQFSCNESNLLANVVVHKAKGWVYFGCISYIHRFSSDMEQLEKYSFCTLDDIEDNNCDFIVLLEMDYKNHHLISCSSRGHCLAHSEENISKIISHTVEPALEVEESALRTFKYFTYPISMEKFSTEISGYWSINENDILTTFVGLPLSPMISTPFSVLYTSNRSVVSIRSLNPNTFGILLGQVDICTKAIHKIVHGFSWGHYGYLLTINETFHSHIARIDYQNGTYSCNYVAIVCTRSESETYQEFRAVVTAFAFASNSTADDAVFGVFQLMNLNKDAEEYVICMYPMNEINDMFALQSNLKSNGQYVKTMVLKMQSLHYVSNYGNANAPASIIVVGLVNNHYVLFIQSFYCNIVMISINKLSSHIVASYYDKIIDFCDYSSSITHFYGTAMWVYARNNLRGIHKMQVQNCYQHNTSFACLETQNPYCGWCFSTLKCCLKSECSNNGISTNWISYDIDTYIALSHMPNSLFESTIQTNVTLAFTSPLPFANNTIIFCLFNFNDSFVLNTTTTNYNNSNIINCTTPHSVFLPWKLFHGHYMTAQLSLTTDDLPKFVQSIPLIFYNCQTYNTCATCIASNYPCNWNMDEHECGHESTWTNNNIFVIGDYNSNNTKLHQYEYGRNLTYCPTFKTIENKPSEIIISADLANHTKQVVKFKISVPKLLKDQNFTCNFIIKDKENKSRTVFVDATTSYITVFAHMFNCILTCSVERLVSSVEEAVTKVELEISSRGGRTHLHNDDKVRLVVVSCAKIGNYCEKCIRHQCGWCSTINKCSEELLCNHTWIREKHACKAKEIDDFYPKQSPVDGGALISISTNDQLRNFLPFIYSVTISGVLCNIDDSFKDLNAKGYFISFDCLLQQFDSTVNNFSGPVIVNCSTGILTSKDNFTFFDPQINDILPKNGPNCGGTNVTIYGDHLHMSEETVVFFDDLECVVFATYADKLQCITSPSRRSCRNKVVVIFRSSNSYNCNRTLDNITFSYDQNMKADDAIHKVPRGIPAGGIDIYVSGDDLTLYENVSLIVEENPNDFKSVFSMCQILNTTFMICPSPKLEIYKPDMSLVNEKRPVQLNYYFSYSTSKTTQQKHISQQQDDSIPKLYPKFLLYPDSFRSAILEISETQQTNWLLENIHMIIIGTILVVALVLVIIVIKFRRIVKTSRKMQQQINKMGLETITMSQWIKRVVIEKHIELNEDKQIMLKLPNISIEPTTVPRVTDDQVLQEMEYELPPDDAWEFDRSDLTLGKCLGQGEFGIIVKGKATGIVEQNLVTTVAVKMLKNIHTDVDMVCLVSEMELMKLIARRRHNNVLCLLGCCTQNGPLLVITEYAPYGNLLDFLQKHDFATTDEVMPGQLNNKMLINFALQVAKGMDHLALIRCIHGDLAAQNILIADNYTMKISGFGLARDVRGKYYYQHKSNARVPVKWMAPEAIHHSRNTTKSDVWSYGILFWEIVTLGSVPYSSFVDVNKLLQAIKSGYRMEKPKNCSMEMYEVMRRCWNNQPDDRPTFTEIVVLLQEMLGNSEVCEPEEIMSE